MDVLDLVVSPFKLNYRYSPFVADLPEGIRKQLRFIFQDRVTFDATERTIYARERGALPRDLVGMVLKPRPFAVVAPRERGDLVEALRLAERHGLPVTPRGNGTSTNGAAVPAEGGIVVDCRGFNEITDLDKERGTVRCGPGVTFQQLKDFLAPHGLAPHVEPETPWASTVGGSIALGRYGLGSARWGSIGQQCVEAEILGADRRVETVTGPGLELVRGLQGSTGVILWATLKVGHHHEPEPVLIQFDSAAEAVRGFQALLAARPWHLALLSPDFVSLRQEATEVKGLQEKFHVFAVFGKGGDHADLLAAALPKAGGKQLDAKAAAKEWDQRHATVALHRLGPTVVTAECLVPIGQLERALGDLPNAARGRLCVDAFAVGPERAMVRVHLMEDERRLEFPTSAGNLFAVVDAAKKLGGTAAYPSMLLVGEAKDALGDHVVAKVKQYKAHRDPWEIMNPGKVWPARMRGLPVAQLDVFLATQRPILKLVRGAVRYKGMDSERAGDLAFAAAVGRSHAGALADVADTVASCSHCGRCNTAAPVVSPWESQRPRGAVQAVNALLVGDGRWTRHLEESAVRMPLHRAGDAVCPSRIPILEASIALRTEVATTLGAFAPLEAMAKSVAANQNPWGLPKAQRGAWLPADFQPAANAKVLYYTGSSAAHLAPAAARAGLELLRKLGPVNTLGAAEPDAGEALYLAGLREAAAKQAEAAMKAILKTGCEILVTPDAHAAWVMKTFWPQVAKDKDLAWTVAVHHAPAYLLPLVGKGLNLGSQVAEKVHFTEPCCAADASSLKLLQKVPGLQATALPILACGSTGGTKEAFPEAAEAAAQRALDLAKAAGAATLATASPGCEAHLAAVGEKLKKGLAVVDVLVLVARGAGIELPGQPAPGAAAPAAPAAEGAAKPAPPKLSPEELEARKKAALEKAAAMKAQKAAQGGGA